MHRNCKSLAGLILFLVLLGPLALAQGPEFSWKQGGKLFDSYFHDADHGWVVEDGARIRRWIGATQEWQFGDTPLDARDDLHGIHFLNALVGFACGSGGTVLKTTDGGVIWDHANMTPILNRNTPPTPAKLNSIFMFNSTDGWVAGDDGSFWFTDTGWDTWGLPSGCSLPGLLDGSSDDPDDVYKIAFSDPMNGFAAADWGRSYVTTTGGCTWDTIQVEPCYGGAAEHPYLEFWDFAFSDANNGILVGGIGVQDGYAFTTSDGGQSWSPSSCFELGALIPGDCTPPTIYGAAMAQSMSGPLPAAAGYASMALAFEPGTANLDQCACTSTAACAGSIWVQKDTIPPGTPKPIFFGAEATGQDDEILLCGDFGVLRRLNLATGTSVDEGTVEYRRLGGGAFFTSDTGCVIAQGNVILMTTDSGENWDVVHEPQPPQTGLFGRDVAFSSSGSRGVAVGEVSFLVWSADDGQTWSPPVSKPNGNVPHEAVAFAPGSDVVYAVGSSALVWRSSDGGVNWSKMTSPQTSETLHGVSFATPSAGFVVGANQAAFLTQDGGVSWTAVPIHGGVAGEDFHAVATWGDGTPAIAVGTDGLVYEKTATRFDVVDPGFGVTQNLQDVQVLTSGTDEHVRICGLGGTVLFRDNGVWSLPKSQTTDPLASISFSAPDEGYVVGRQFLVMKYE
jgi:photosystem II stability/assembly factor-like uncharacterized protein